MVAENARCDENPNGKEADVKQLDWNSEILAFEMEKSGPIATLKGTPLTQQERDALADRMEKVILERKRMGAERRRQARLRQLEGLERSRARAQSLAQA